MALNPELRTDLQTRMLFATDASMYQVLPEGVAFPKNAGDLGRILQSAAVHHKTVTARAAGTSLAGQTVGPGWILDTSRYMNKILHMDSSGEFAVVEPGVIRDMLNLAAAPAGRFFAPDPATSNRCMFGGMIGNNSSGSFSLRYGTVKDHILELDTVLASGERVVFKPVSTAELQNPDSSETHLRLAQAIYALVASNRGLIERAFPSIALKRSNAGYGLDRLLRLKPFNPDGDDFSLVPLLCGSEGTLALTVSAKIKLTPVPQKPVLLIPQFSSIDTAMRATVEALAFDPSAIELVDDQIVEAARANPAMDRLRFFIKGSPKCFLIIQFDGSGKFDPLEQALKLQAVYKKQGYTAVSWLEEDQKQQKKIWELRKAGLGLLMGSSAESKSPTFCEDTAVPVANLPEYIRAFQDLLVRYKTTCVFYAHASVGELHLRPVLDLKQPGNISRMVEMQAEITELVKKYGGTISGEHGDGRARSQFLESLYGKEITELFRQVKELFDPDYRLNPGIIVNPAPFTGNLRYTGIPVDSKIKTEFRWHRENGFSDALERCNGAGVCRKLESAGGTMCPSYQVTREERDSTRGRANLFRQVFSGNVPQPPAEHALKDALELCLGCKACKTECPAGVDMTRMKSEFLNRWHEKHGASFSDRLLASAHKTNGFFRYAPALFRTAFEKMQQSRLFKKMMGLDPERGLPVAATVSFRSAFWKSYNPSPNPPVFLFVDHYTDVYEPQVASDAQKVLERLGYGVQLLRSLTAGRAQISLGFLKAAKETMKTMLDELELAALFNIPVVGLEPSEVLTVLDDYPDLCDAADMERAEKLVSGMFLFEEFVASRLHPKGLRVLQAQKKEKVFIHAHCHAKALEKAGFLVDLFSKTGYETELLQTGCCGMAGAFGYRHGDLSFRIGELSVFPKVRASEGEGLICAHGFSCRHQIADATHIKTLHPAQILAAGFRD